MLLKSCHGVQLHQSSSSLEGVDLEWLGPSRHSRDQRLTAYLFIDSNCNVQEGRTLYSATAQTGKHTDPVWQVRWAAAEGQRGLQFFSVSTDGRFTLWTLAKNELIHQVGP